MPESKPECEACMSTLNRSGGRLVCTNPLCSKVGEPQTQVVRSGG